MEAIEDLKGVNRDTWVELSLHRFMRVTFLTTHPTLSGTENTAPYLDIRNHQFIYPITAPHTRSFVSLPNTPSLPTNPPVIP